MGSNATASTAVTSTSVAGAAMVIIGWLLSYAHVVMTQDVVIAGTILLGAGIHAAYLRWGFPPVTDTIAVVPGNPTPVAATVKESDAPAAADPKQSRYTMPPLSASPA